MQARWASQDEIARWDALVVTNSQGGNMLQSLSFADVKAHSGWTPRYVVFEGDSAYTAAQVEAMEEFQRSVTRADAAEPKRKKGEEPQDSQPSFRLPDDAGQPRLEMTVYAVALEKKLPLMGRIWYFPKGPEVYGVADIPPMMDALQAFSEAEKLRLFAAKVEPEVMDTPERAQYLRSHGMEKSFNIQIHDSTPIVYTDRSEDDLFASFSSKGRNMVRRGLKEELDIREVEVDEQNMATMFSLMQSVGQGHANVRLRDYSYYERFWRQFAQRGQGRLYFCYEDGEPAVGAYVVTYGNKTTYKDGGSRPKRKAKGDAHAMQWRAMTDSMRDHESVVYDLCCCPPKSQMKNTDHPFYGLGLFKTSFTRGRSIDYVGVYDRPMRPWAYRAWTTAVEKVLRNVVWYRTKQPMY